MLTEQLNPCDGFVVTLIMGGVGNGIFHIDPQPRQNRKTDLLMTGNQMRNDPKCEACGLPMMCGQQRTHGVCDPLHPAYAKTYDGFAKALLGSETSANAKWSPLQQKAVDAAIERVAQNHPEFTADHIWLELGEGFPSSKGMAARLTAAANRKIIEQTGALAHSTRPGNHNQRLSIWRSVRKGSSMNPLFVPLAGASH
jgi:hypothetical protein